MVNRHTASVENGVRASDLAFSFAYATEDGAGGMDLADVLAGKTRKRQAPHVEVFLETARAYWPHIQGDAEKLCERFHYSHFLPPLTRGIGLWRDGHPDLAAAACCFGGAPARVWSQYPILELNRLVRREDVTAPLTGLISETVKALRWAFPDIKLLISYADRTEGHTGWVYQAASWNYAGARDPIVVGTKIDGKFYHQRTVVSKFGTSALLALKDMHPGALVEQVTDEGKHVYWKPLRRGGNKLAARLKLGRKPYPKESREGGRYIQRSEEKRPDLDEAL